MMNHQVWGYDIFRQIRGGVENVWLVKKRSLPVEKSMATQTIVKFP